MTDNEWMTGFRLATRLYYMNGNLDIPDDAVTKGGYKIGEWIKYTRENVDKLSSFDINNLTSYGMIWSSNRGLHDQFGKMMKKLMKCNKTENGKIPWSEIEKDAQLKKWANLMINGRRECDNAVITLREVDMMSDEGFPWGENWPDKLNEERTWVSKNSYVAQAIRQQCMQIVGNKKVLKEAVINQYKQAGMVLAPVDKNNNKENNDNIKIVEIDKSNWQNRLLNKYLGIDKEKVSNEDKIEYLALIRKSTKTEKEKNFLLMLNDGYDGEAAWIVGDNYSSEIPPSVNTIIRLLNKWVEYGTKTRIDIKNCDLSEYEAQNGMTISSLMNMLVKLTDDEDIILVKNELDIKLYIRYIQELSNKQEKEFKCSEEPDNCIDVTDKSEDKEAVEENVSIEDKKEPEIKADWTVKKPRVWFNKFDDELRQARKKYDITPNTKEEAEELGCVVLTDMIPQAYDNRDRLESKVFRARLRENGFFFIENSSDDILELRKAFNKFLKEIGDRYYGKLESPQARLIVRLLVKVKALGETDAEILKELDKVLTEDFAEYREFIGVYNNIMENGTVDDKDIARRIKNCIPLVLKSKKMRA